MSRTIKFRIYNPKEKKMVESGATPMMLCSFFKATAVFNVRDKMEYQQFTELLDKRGKEIYEEDVVKMENGEIGKVVYEGCCFILKRKDPQKYISWADEFFEDCEIIGNKYDNPIKP